MKQGKLVYDPTSRRMDVRFEDGSRYGGFHCGDCMYVQWAGVWLATRIEMGFNDAWYLVGIQADDLRGLKVRI